MGIKEGARRYFLTPPPQEESHGVLSGSTTRRRVLTAGAGILLTPALIRAGQIADFIGIGPTELNNRILQATSQHSLESMKRTHLVVVGDSIALGYDVPRETPKSSGEYVRDAINHPKKLDENWDCTVLAYNGDVIDDIFAQIDEIPQVVQGEQDVDLIVSIGGNDFRRFIETVKPQALEVYKNPVSLALNPLDLLIAEKMSEVAGRYRTEIAPRLGDLRKQLASRGTQLNRIAFINLPNMANTDFELHTEDPDVPLIRYTYATKDIDGKSTFLKNLGKGLTRKANSVIGDAIWASRRQIGTDIIGLNAYELEGEELHGYHPTRAGQQKLAVQYLQKTFTPPDYERKPNVTLFAAAQ